VPRLPGRPTGYPIPGGGRSESLRRDPSTDPSGEPSVEASFGNMLQDHYNQPPLQTRGCRLARYAPPVARKRCAALLLGHLGRDLDLTFIRLVRTYSVDLGEGFGEVVGWGFGGGEGVASGLDRDGAVSAGATHEFLDAPTGLVLDPVGYG
jgi:hypothetical protein